MIIPFRNSILAFSVFLLLSFVFLEKWEEASLESEATKDDSFRVRAKKRKRHDAKEKTDKHCDHVCLERVQQHREQWGGKDLLNLADVKSLLVRERRLLEDKLKVDYGEENFANIFTVNGTSRKTFLSANGEPDGPSTQRFKRKLKLKILGMQQAIQKELGVAGTCQCDGTESSRHYRHLDSSKVAHTFSDYIRRIMMAAGGEDEETTTTGDVPSFADYYEQFVWATGGHSAAAGHGNLFNESYTSYLEQAITPVFRSIGIEFEGRNHAMGGTSSAPEVALCQEAIFGQDADVITYDYGMTDAGRWQKKVMYDERMAMHSNQPARLDINILVADSGEHQTTIQREEGRGLTVMYLDPNEFTAMKNAFPDTFGKNQEQIDAMPPMVRNFRCRDYFEKGDPFCGEKKYDNAEICPDRGMMADWHPGLKMMALWGNTFALFLSDMLLDAVDELESASNRTNLMNQLRQDEVKDNKSFRDSAAAKDSTDYEAVPKDSDLVNGRTNASIFFTEPSVCRTARLPSQSRYLGIAPESEKIGVVDYEKGISMEAARNLTTDNNTDIRMPLVYDESERQKGCEVELNRDYKDYFFASNRIGWTGMTIPNDSENRVYVRDSQKLRGVLVMCLVTCPWGDCLPGEMRNDALSNGQVLLQVNGDPVTNTTDLIDDCVVLRGKNGHEWQPNKDGRYQVQARVVGNSTDFAFLRVSSLILL